MPLPRSPKWILLLAGLLLCLGGLLAAFTLFLPIYLETRLLPRWAVEAGLDPQIIRLRRIGFRGTDIGPVRLNMGDLSFGQVDAIQLDYSPASLALGRINAIVLSGLNLSLTLDEAGNAIAGWKPTEPQASPEVPAVSMADLPEKMPIGLKRLTLRNALVSIHWRGRTLEIPLEMDLDTSRLDQGHLQAEARLSPRGSPIHLSGELENGAYALAVTMSAKGLEMARFSDLIALFTDLPLTGRVDLEAQARCRLKPLALTWMTGEARLCAINLSLPFGRLVHRSSPGAEEMPIVIQWKSEDGRNFPWSLGPFSYHGPALLHVEGVEGRFSPDTHGWHNEALARVVLPVQSLNASLPAPISVRHPLALDIALSARAEPERGLLWELHAAEAMPTTESGLCLQQTDWQVESQVPRIEVAGEMNEGGMSGEFQVSVSELSAQHPTAAAKLPFWDFNGTFQTSPALAIQSSTNLFRLQFKFDEALLTLPQTRMNARLENDGRNRTIAGELALTDGRAQYAPQDVELRSISAFLPVRYPLEAHPPAGNAAIGQMLWRSRNLGSAQGKMGLGRAGFWAELSHADKLFQGMNVRTRLDLSRDQALLKISVPAFTSGAALNLGQIVPEAEDFLFQGRMEAQVEAQAKGNMIQSRALIHVDHGTLRHAARQLYLGGIACDLRLEDLINPRSGPRQQLQVADLTLGKITARQLNVDFQLEPDSSLFIEKAGMQWCKGTMQTQAFRLMPGRDEVEVTLYGDRLNLALLLDQLGVAQGSGEGAVNGRIPLLWKNGELRFDNGFLYSTPGQTGTIRLSGTQALLEGLAPGTPQHTQLDIASEALKDYTYNWARVDLRSDQELLLVSLKLNGKPNRLLPFAYDPQSGGFKRFSGQGQAEFQGINIDLNFKTPLREILHYRQLMVPKNK